MRGENVASVRILAWHGVRTLLLVDRYAWVTRKESFNPAIDWQYEGVGSGSGVKWFINNEIDFGASDAAMKDSEIDQVSTGAILIPVTAGMVVLAYNLPGVDTTLKLPRDVYVDIFLGNIYRWDDQRILDKSY